MSETSKIANQRNQAQNTIIQAGTSYYDARSGGWNLNVGSGPRIFTTPPINFDSPFDQPPLCSISLNAEDIDHEHNARLRVQITPKSVTNTSFTVDIMTWDDSEIWGAGISWLAIAQN